MSNIGMPVSNPTADCIWTSFRSSHKRHLILTGGRGSGKTTLLAQLFSATLPGIISWAEPGVGVFLRENTSANTAPIGVFDPTIPHRERRMRPLAEGFLTLGIAALKACETAQSEWVSIDEIGFLETTCPPYQEALLHLLETKRVAAVVRKERLPFLQTLCSREDAFVVDLDHPAGNLGVVLMASGLGKRFGGNKLMANFRGEPLICHALAATEMFAKARVVVTRHTAVAALCEARGVPVVLHPFPGRNDTVRLGVEALPPVDRLLFCAGDQPLLRQETVQALALCAANDPSSIWRPICQGTPGAPVIFPAWSFAELQSLPAGMGGGTVIRAHTDRLRTMEIADALELCDVDTPDDLANLQK